MKYIYGIFNWLFGTVFLLLAILALFDSIALSAIFLFMSFLVLPPIRKFFYSRTGKGLPLLARSVILVCLAAVSLGFIGYIQDTPAKRHARFIENRAAIISEIRSFIDEGDLRSAMDEASLYEEFGDNDIFDLIDIIEAKKKEEERLSEIDRITRRIVRIPSEDPELLVPLYERLLSLDPDGRGYEESIEYHTEQIREKERLEREKAAEHERQQRILDEQIARFGEPPRRSPWDGSVYVVERYLKRIANDPDSIDIDGCTNVIFTEQGWFVGCRFRGRNVFGGMILNAAWFTIVDGAVIEMQETSPSMIR